MKIDLCRAAQLLLSQDKILILAHSHPDGDTLGSAFALCRGLQLLGKHAKVFCSDAIPSKFSYLWREVKEQEFTPDYIVAVDVADTKLLGNPGEELYSDKVNLCIDHHGSNLMYAKETLLDVTAGGTCEVICMLLNEMNVEISADIADCIYTGISTDTGCFRYSNATSRSYRIAADMIDKGADAAIINQVMFETKTRTYAQLERLALDTMKLYFDGKCAIIRVTQEMYRQSGSDESECDPIASLPRQIEGVLVGAMIREREDGTFKVSVRTHRPVDASKLCGMMNGGGHSRAAGCQLDGPIENAEAILLENIKKVLES